MKKQLQHAGVLLLLFTTSVVHAQWDDGLWVGKQAYNWCFGKNVRIDFNSVPPALLPVAEMFSFCGPFEGSAVISNENGGLLFYGADYTIWNKNHQIMQNGNFLINGGSSSTQWGVIVPKPGSNHIYYLFNVGELGVSIGLSYSEIDMSLDNGLGAVTANKNIVLNPDALTEKITAVHHANGEDIWVITHLDDSNKFVAYLVSDQGISPTPVVSAVGTKYPAYPPPFPFLGYSTGQLKVSPDGSRLVAAYQIDDITIPNGKLEIFDFNNTHTG